MVWPHVKEGRGGYHQEDVKHASARKEKKGEAQEKMVGQYQGGHERVQDDGRHGTRSKCVAHEDKGRPIATWRRPLGEKKVRRGKVFRSIYIVISEKQRYYGGHVGFQDVRQEHKFANVPIGFVNLRNVFLDIKVIIV